ncbi:hypothetical protein SASPL_149288 [Salvia splendens]|uniref:Mut7-C RNAse domain-containing protein n=1 Tax=Salvia splendens TaxID=180675 RepID=A0A8X8Z541_SALSN|nr:hypothetical protein SASPL_149288 [Salvia splendens]
MPAQAGTRDRHRAANAAPGPAWAVTPPPPMLGTGRDSRDAARPLSTPSIPQMMSHLWNDTRFYEHSQVKIVMLQAEKSYVDIAANKLNDVRESKGLTFLGPLFLAQIFREKQCLIMVSATISLPSLLPGGERPLPFSDEINISNILKKKNTNDKMRCEISHARNISREDLLVNYTPFHNRPAEIDKYIENSNSQRSSDGWLRSLEKGGKAVCAEYIYTLLPPARCFKARVSIQAGLGFPFVHVEPFIDISAIYNQLQTKQQGRRTPKQTKSLATICEEVLGISLSKVCMLSIGVAVTEKVGAPLIHCSSFRCSRYQPKTSKNKAKKIVSKPKTSEIVEDWQGPPPWDPSAGGDSCPKFLCDVMVEGLAKHLRCVGIDAAIPHLRKPDTRDLIDQAQKEKRVLLTRDAKILRHEYLIKNQIYRLKSLLKNDQLLEVIETFQLKISEDQLMSRCTKCNGKFIQKPLTTQEAVEAAKGFQVIPNCLFNRNLEFWQCTDCNQLYWEGTQYHNAVQKFIDVCKLNEQPEGDDAL